MNKNYIKSLYLSKLNHLQASHPDYTFVEEALKTMREVTISVNERKRRMESLEKLILWQQEVEGWEVSKCLYQLTSLCFDYFQFNLILLQGSNLVEQSSLLIHENDVSRVFNGLWFTDVSAFLFDHQLILCKKVSISSCD